MRKYYLTVGAIMFAACLFAQQPFEKYGYKVKVATLSNGKYVEFFDQDSLVQIGTVVINTNTGKISHFVTVDTAYSEATLEPELISRWISPDPLSEKYFDYSPYNYVLNNPVNFTDPDGMEVYDRNDNKADITTDREKNKITINNAGDLDAALVETLIATFLESETGMETIEALNVEGEKFQIINSDKMGVIRDGNQYGFVDGLTDSDAAGKYDAKIFLFNTTKQFDGNYENRDQFDFIKTGGRIATDSEKNKLKSFDAKHFGAKENHQNTQNALNRELTDSERQTLDRINATSRQNRLFGYITTLIHETTHGKGEAKETPAYRREIRSFQQSKRQ